MFKFNIFDKVRITDENECYVDDPKMVADHVKDHYNATCYCMSSQPSDDDVGQVLARWEDNGQNIYYVRVYEDDECKTPSCYCYCMDEVGLEKAEGEIKAFDIVKVTCIDGVYPTYDDWVLENIKDRKLLAHWAYGDRLLDSNGKKYEVVVIAPHGKAPSVKLAFIKSCGMNAYRCYLIDAKALKKENVTQEKTVFF